MFAHNQNLKIVLRIVVLIGLMTACINAPTPTSIEAPTPPQPPPISTVISPMPPSGFEGTVIDESGAKIAAVVIDFTSTDGSIKKETLTLSDGKYKVVLPPGAYKVTATHQAYQTYNSDPNDWENEGSGFIYNDIHLLVKVTEEVPLGTLEGIVLDQTTGGKVANVHIIFTSKNTSFSKEVISDINGNYSIDLPQGGYHVAVQQEGYEPFDTGQGAVGVTGNSVTTYNISLQEKSPTPVPEAANGVYQGIVEDQDSHQMISGAHITFESPDRKISKVVISDENGRYRVELPIGGYYVTVTHDAYQTYTTKPGFFVIPGTGNYTGNISLLPKSHVGAPFPTPLADARPGAEKAPSVEISVSPDQVAVGQKIYVKLDGTDDNGLAAIWWWGQQTNDPNLNKAHWMDCSKQSTCSNTWEITTTVSGNFWLCANARDIDYPIPGEAHQASEGRGIPCVLVQVSS
jgi:hypothetical protein